MSTRSIYDNWERLVTAVSRRQQNWELFHAPSRSPSLLSQASDFSSSRSFHQDDQHEYELPFGFSTERGSSSYPAHQQSQVATVSESIHPRIVFATDNWPAFGYEDVTESPFHVVGEGTERNKLVFFGDHDPKFDFEDLLMDSTRAVGNDTFVISYKTILEDGTIISVKKLKDVFVTDTEFQKHMEVIGRIGHKSVAQPRAYYHSTEMNECLLVYDSYNEDSLFTWLHGYRRRHLEWKKRIKIAVDAARAIAFIHTKDDGKLVHGNIRSSNILLSNQLRVTVSEVGLAELMAPIDSIIITSWGCCAPEVRGIREVSQAADVFSFGVVLLELLFGKPPLTEYEGKVVHLSWLIRTGTLDWTSQVFDEQPFRTYGVIKEQIEGLKQIADRCLEDYLFRPKMALVVAMLENLTQVDDLELEVANGPGRNRPAQPVPRPEPARDRPAHIWVGPVLSSNIWAR